MASSLASVAGAAAASTMGSGRNPTLLQRVLRSMEKIAPLSLSESAWDNTGLLVEAPYPRPGASRVFLTIDLTHDVLDEALHDPAVGVIVAYHPPLFRPIKRLVTNDDRQAVALRCIASGVSVYSPHTALDNCVGGINDWLSRGLGPGRTAPLSLIANPPPGQDGAGSGRLHTLDAPIALDELVRRVKAHLGIKYVRVARAAGPWSPSASQIGTAQASAQRPLTTSSSPAIAQTTLAASSTQPQPPTLASLASAAVVAPDHRDKLISTIAICAGSGASVLSSVRADAYLTGEMSHHEVLAATSHGTNVILCEHSNSERGYLSQVLQSRLLSLLKVDHGLDVEADIHVDVVVSQRDQDPLTIA